MRRLIYAILALAVVYGGYWFVGSNAVEKGAVAALDQARAAGIEVDYESLNTTGFPSRFDTTLTKATIRDPKSGWGWQGAFAQVFALSYQPNKVIVIAPPEQVVLTPGGAVKLTAEGLRASASVGVSSATPLTSAIMESGKGQAELPGGALLGFEKLLAAVEPTETEMVYKAFVEMQGVALPGVGPLVDDVRIDGTVKLDHPLDRNLASIPGVEAIHFSDTRVVWGGGTLTASGGLTVDAAGIPSGTIDLTATDWKSMIEAAVEAGLIKPEVAPTYINMGTMLASGGPDIAMPLKFENGAMALGPFPLGAAPRLR